MNEQQELLADIEKLKNYIWKKPRGREYTARYWIRSHIGKSPTHCNVEELKILRYLMAFKAKDGECPILEHRNDSDYRRRQAIPNLGKWQRIREEMTIKTGGKCEKCQQIKDDLTIDHIKPIYKGGSSELINLQLLCVECHNKKSLWEGIYATKKFKKEKLHINIALAKKYYYEYLENKKYGT